eukprot:CAMPEP_0178542462 /NCGR_PEP_ID=MMETSP0697-20121206/2073_1 /TAXON_ID=265572 /ORGANISM="Extubocellulus spinifer, Strain CCMP396" /LENGTH=219 /DNA_ID=CAMNT_0020174867 /DNA_START=158 /DNA_END=817 /DNA_ORIENTATION=+
MAAQRATMKTLSSPSSSLAAFEPMLISTTTISGSEVGDTLRSIVFTDVGAEAGDAFRSIIYGAIGFIACVFLIATVATVLALPQFEEIVKESDPEKYESIIAKLGEGETTIWQRDDLVEELFSVGMASAAAGGGGATKELLAKVKKEKVETGTIDMDKVEEELKEITDFTIDGYVVGVRNFEKKQRTGDTSIFEDAFVTETDKELVAILEEELEKLTTS